MKRKSLSVKKITPKSFNFKKILKDKKVLEIYNDFAKNFENCQNLNKIAVAVSGGPDSMALCFLISCYKFKKNKKIQIFFYLIDHALRKDSEKEAKMVRRELNLNKINLKIIKWKGSKPKSNLQSIARQKRYEILFNECNKYNIKTILTAHHQDDIYETFFIRLLRGSGAEGLSSFVEREKKFNFKKSVISIFRPLLNNTKQDLTYITNKVFKFYVNDPYNQNEKFQRVRLRNLILNLKNQGLDFKKLKLTARNLSSNNKAINQIVNKNISQNVFFNKKRYLLSSEFFLYPEEVVFKSLSILIKKISKKYYPPRGRKLINLIKQLNEKDQFKATLGGTVVEKIHNSVLVYKETRKKS